MLSCLRTLILGSLLAFVLQPVLPASAFPSFLDSFETKYGTQGYACSQCHGSNSSVANLNSYGTSLRTGTFDALEPTYAPSLSSPTGTTVLPGTTTQTTLTFDPGQGIVSSASGTPGSGKPTTNPMITTYTPTLPTGFTLGTTTGTSALLNITLTSLEKGNARRANSPFVLAFVPQNNNFLKPTIASTLSANQVSVSFANIAPVAADDSFSGPGDAVLSGNVLTQSGVDSDADDTTLTAQLVSGPATGTLSLNTDGSFSYTPPAPAAMTDTQVTFTYNAVDSEGLASTAPATVTLTLLGVIPANNPPVAQPDAFAINEDTVLTGDVLVDNGSGADSDPDAMTTLSTTVVTPPAFGTLALATNGSFTYTPVANSTGAPTTNQDSFTYRLSDGAAVDDATATITITPVNDAPTASAIIAPTVDESAAQQSLELLQAGSVSDPDGDTLTVSNVTLTIVAPTLTSPTVNFTVSGSTLSFDPADLSDLDENEVADLTFSYQISDGTAAPIGNTLNIQVIGFDNGVGRVAGAYADTLRARYNNHFLDQNAADASCLTCHQVGQVNADVDTVNDCTSTVFNAYGLMICQARDTSQPPLSDLSRRLAQVEPMFAPKLTSSEAIQIQDSLVPGDPVGSPLAADPGRTVDNTASTIRSFAIVNGSTLGTTDATNQFRIEDSGQIRVAGVLTPGVYTLDIRPINDAGQKDNSGSARPNDGFYPIETSLLRFVTITVVGAPPIGVADAVTTDNVTPVAVAVLANDLGGPSTTVAVATAPANGTTVVNADLSITYTPTTGFSGTDSFSYTGTNSFGTTTATPVTITVVSAGGAIARDDVASTPLDQPVTVDVLANDGGTGLSASIVTGPTNGTATLSGGQVTYTPNTGYVGQDLVVYSATNTVASSQATLTITVTSVSGSNFADATNDPELKKIAQALGDTCNALGGTPAGADAQDLAAFCAGLATDISAGGGIDATLAAIRNEEALVVADQTMLTARATGRTLMNRISRLRAGKQGGLDVSGLSMQIGDETLDGGLLDDLFGVFQSAQNSANAASPWGFFIGGDLTFASGDATSRTSGFDLQALNLTAGVDYRFTPNTVGGVAISYAIARTEFNNGGDLNSSSVEASLYGSHAFAQMPGLTLSGAATFGFDWYEQDRGVTFTSGGVTTNRIASSSYTGRHLNIVAELGYTLPLPKEVGGAELPGSLTLFSNADYLVGWVDGYTETGAGGLNLTVGSQTFQSFVASVGIEVSQAYSNDLGVFEPYIRTSVNAELLNDGRSVTSRFAAGGPTAASFTVTENGSDEIYAYLEIGSRFKLNNGTLGLSYATTAGQQTLTQHRISANFEMSVLGNDTVRLGVSSNASATSGIGFDAFLGYELNF